MPKRQASDGSWLRLVENEPEEVVPAVYKVIVTWMDKDGLRVSDDRLPLEESLRWVIDLVMEHEGRLNSIFIEKLNTELSK